MNIEGGGINMKRNSIEISTRRIKLKLLFKNRVVIVADNSATGKTLLANTLVDYAKTHKEYSDISYFNSTTDESGKPLLEALKTMSDRFIIIDRADITLDSEARDYIFFDNLPANINTFSPDLIIEHSF